MADLTGTIVISGLKPTSTDDTYETHSAIYGKGGHRTVTNTTERDAIPSDRREIGMSVWCASDSTQYRLIGGIANVNWTPVPGGVTTVGGLDYLGVLSLMGLS
jgi:hypothetical protein